MNEPNDDSFTVSPFSRQSVISFKTSSTNADDSLFARPPSCETASHKSTLVTVFPVPVIACPALSANNLFTEIMSLARNGQQRPSCMRMKTRNKFDRYSTPRSPAQQRGTPGEASAHGFEQHQIAFLHASVLHGDR